MTDDYEKTYNTFNEVAQKAMNRFYLACLDKTRDEMSKIEVTPDMVERGVEYCRKNVLLTYAGPEIVKHFLESVINPPAPGVKVTWEMGIAGQALALKARNQGACGDGDLWVLVKDIYRAMRKLEPKP